MADLFEPRGFTFNHTTAALSGLSGGATTYSTTGTQTYEISGRLYTTAADTGVEVPDVDETTGEAFLALENGKACLFVFAWDTAGEMAVSQGPIVNTADITNGSAAYHFPSIPSTVCPFAYVTISHANATAFTFGTSNWNATGVTIGTVVNCGTLPNQPLTAASA